MLSLYHLIDTVLEIYSIIVIAWVILSWLVAFNVLNTHNRFVYVVGDALNRLTEPALAPFRRIIPSFGGIDISPLALLLAIFFLRMLLREYWPGIGFGI
ncbi:MAG: YggT family protein [Rhodospirillaceae bacterium]|nr:YggT family protein [Rhodospirillaceae bacterium]MCA8933491.1 YggT family protein [Rhodospirillaceae bacterium]